MKAILISIQPKWVAKILNGEKTIEIRKTLPKCDLPIDVYVYCTKENDKHEICIYDNTIEHRIACSRYHFLDHSEGARISLFNPRYIKGKVVAKFTLNKITEIDKYSPSYVDLKGTCVSYDEYQKYVGNKICYAWHIDNLVIFDKPKELSEFRYYKKFSEIDYMLPVPRKETCERLVPLTRAPESYCYVEV